MASDRIRDTGLSNNDGRGVAGFSGAPGARPAAPGQMSTAFGRTPSDLATDQPAGKADLHPGDDDRGLPDADDVTSGFLGTTKVDPDTGGDIRRGRRRILRPQVDPDTRLGLQPTVEADRLPDQPPIDAQDDRGSRVMTAAVAALISDGLVIALTYLMIWAGQIGGTLFLATAQRLFGVHGALDHVVGIAAALVCSALCGALYGLLVQQPGIVNGILFAIVVQAVLWMALAPVLGVGLFYGASTQSIVLPLVFNVLIWGGLLGWTCRRWLRPPYAAATEPLVA